jgi:hypothetical protein
MLILHPSAGKAPARKHAATLAELQEQRAPFSAAQRDPSLQSARHQGVE